MGTHGPDQPARPNYRKSMKFAFLTCLCALALLPAQATQPLVAIHDSELTRALETQPATAPTPPGTGYQWWPTNWHYFVMPDSVKEALRSDGTAFSVVSDADIAAGTLLDTNGQPRYPIVISLGAEAVSDAEAAQFTNYVAAGGFLLVGSSAFTRHPDGTTRGDFAFANAMGVHNVNSSLENWGGNSTFSKLVDDALVRHIPGGVLDWTMSGAAEEIPGAFLRITLAPLKTWFGRFRPAMPPSSPAVIRGRACYRSATGKAPLFITHRCSR